MGVQDGSSGGSGGLRGEAPLPLRPGHLVCVWPQHGSPPWCQSLPWSLRPPCASLLQTSEEIFQHLQNIVDFSKNVMKEFLGENYVHCGVSDFDLHSLNSQAHFVSVIPAS